VWGHNAGKAAQHLTKGRHVGVSGSLQQQEWIGHDGTKRTRVFVKATQLDYLDRVERCSEQEESTSTAGLDSVS
jgi:single-strand DNA-binding protein